MNNHRPRRSFANQSSTSFRVYIIFKIATGVIRKEIDMNANRVPLTIIYTLLVFTVMVVLTWWYNNMLITVKKSGCC